MQLPFGHTFKFTISLSRSWLSVGPGWAALAGVLAGGTGQIGLTELLQLFSLWLLVDPILGTLWELSVQQGLWRKIWEAELPAPTKTGFYLPYTQAGSSGERFIVNLRRYQVWWRAHYWPQNGDGATAFGLGTILALLISFFLNPTIFWLTLMALGLIMLAGLGRADLTTASGGRLQSIVQLLLPWAIGASLWSALTPLSLLLSLAFWVTYLGGLRMLGNHHQADILFWLGQITVIALLLALRLLPGAAVVAAMFVAQRLVKTKFTQPETFLPKVQPYLIVSLLVAGFFLGR